MFSSMYIDQRWTAASAEVAKRVAKASAREVAREEVGGRHRRSEKVFPELRQG